MMIQNLHDLANGEDVHKKIDELVDAVNVQSEIFKECLYQFNLIRDKQVSQGPYYNRLHYIQQLLDKL